MKNIVSQKPLQEINSLVLNARWEDLNEYFKESTLERSEDLADLLANLRKKIDQQLDSDCKHSNVFMRPNRY